MTNMFNPKAINTSVRNWTSKKVYDISNLLFDKNKLIKLNNKSLKYRNKLG